MRVGIVLHPFGNPHKGLEQYVYESARSMAEGDEEGIHFTVFVRGDSDVSKFPPRTKIVRLPDMFWWKLHLLRFSPHVDTFIFFTESAPLFLWRKSIIVFFDASYYYFFEKTFFSKMKRHILVWWRGNMLRRALHVVTISEASKRDLEEKFSLSQKHVTVIYPGFKTPPETQVPRIHLDTPFFLGVGPTKERKNIHRLIEAFASFREKTGNPHHLCIVGRRVEGSYAESVAKLIEKHHLTESVTFMTDVEDSTLSELYACAEALVYPSLLEGFGLPILEALSQGCMVITSSTTSTREVAGDAGIFVNPEDTEEIAQAMSRVANKGYNREDFLRRATAQCQRFSWKLSGDLWRKTILASRRFSVYGEGGPESV